MAYQEQTETGFLWVTMTGNDSKGRRNSKKYAFATIQAALAAASEGDTINVGKGLFLTPPETSWKSGIHLKGSGRPRWVFTDGVVKELIGGTRLYGLGGLNITAYDTILYGIAISDLGMDSGDNIRDLYFPGQSPEGISFTGVDTGLLVGIPGALNGLRMWNVVSLCPSTNRGTTHSFSIQNAIFSQFDNLVQIHGHHGIAYKSEHSVLNNITCIDALDDAIICVASDPVTLPCSHTTWNNVTIYSGNGIVVGGCGSTDITFNNITMQGRGSGDFFAQFRCQQNAVGNAVDSERITFNNVTASNVQNGVSVSNASPVGTGIGGLSGHVIVKDCCISNAHFYGTGTGAVDANAGIVCREGVDYNHCSTEGFYMGAAVQDDFSGKLCDFTARRNIVGIYAYGGTLTLDSPVRLESNIYDTVTSVGAAVVTLPVHWESTYGYPPVANSTSEASILSSATERGTKTVKAKYVNSNVIRFTSAGKYSRANSPTLTVRAKYGTGLANLTALAFPPVTITGDGDYFVDVTYRVREPGGSVVGLLTMGTLTIQEKAYPVSNFAIVDSTNDNVFDITAQWSETGAGGTANSISHYMALLEVSTALKA